MFRSIVLLVGGLASLSAVSLVRSGRRARPSNTAAAFMPISSAIPAGVRAADRRVEGGSKDPRVFYFRGLTYLKLGRPQDAAMDFRKGAELESKDINRFYNVGKALERVQGSARVNWRNIASTPAWPPSSKRRKSARRATKR